MKGPCLSLALNLSTVPHLLLENVQLLVLAVKSLKRQAQLASLQAEALDCQSHDSLGRMTISARK